MATAALKKSKIEYPSSDGKPMAETDAHRNWMIININRLSRHFSGRKVYVSGNLLIYYVEGDARKCVAPDTFVVKNCKPGKRDIFQIWKERRKPNFALETTSKTTRGEDSGEKKEKICADRRERIFSLRPIRRLAQTSPARLQPRSRSVRKYPAGCRGGCRKQGTGHPLHFGRWRLGDVRRCHGQTIVDRRRMGKPES